MHVDLLELVSLLEGPEACEGLVVRCLEMGLEGVDGHVVVAAEELLDGQVRRSVAVLDHAENVFH